MQRPKQGRVLLGHFMHIMITYDIVISLYTYIYNIDITQHQAWDPAEMVAPSTSWGELLGGINGASSQRRRWKHDLPPQSRPGKFCFLFVFKYSMALRDLESLCPQPEVISQMFFPHAPPKLWRPLGLRQTGFTELIGLYSP